MITVVDTTEGMTMIKGMTADMIVVTMISDMIVITVAIVTIETTDPFLPVLQGGLMPALDDALSLPIIQQFSDPARNELQVLIELG